MAVLILLQKMYFCLHLLQKNTASKAIRNSYSSLKRSGLNVNVWLMKLFELEQRYSDICPPTLGWWPGIRHLKGWFINKIICWPAHPLFPCREVRGKSKHPKLNSAGWWITPLGRCASTQGVQVSPQEISLPVLKPALTQVVWPETLTRVVQEQRSQHVPSNVEPNLLDLASWLDLSPASLLPLAWQTTGWQSLATTTGLILCLLPQQQQFTAQPVLLHQGKKEGNPQDVTLLLRYWPDI